LLAVSGSFSASSTKQLIIEWSPLSSLI